MLLIVDVKINTQMIVIMKGVMIATIPVELVIPIFRTIVSLANMVTFQKLMELLVLPVIVNVRDVKEQGEIVLNAQMITIQMEIPVLNVYIPV